MNEISVPVSPAHLQGPGCRILAALLAEEQRVTHLGLRPRGEPTPLSIVRVREFGDTLRARRHVRRSAVLPIQGTVRDNFRLQASLELPPEGPTWTHSCAISQAGPPFGAGRRSPLPSSLVRWARLQHAVGSIDIPTSPSQLALEERNRGPVQIVQIVQLG